MLNKKIICTLISCVLLVSMLLTGCGKPAEVAKPEQKNEAQEQKQEEATLTMWIPGWETDAAKLFEEDAKEWKQKHPNVTVKVVPLTLDAYNQKVPATVAGGTNPDIALTDIGTMTVNLADKGKLLALDDYGVNEIKDKFYDGVWNTTMWKGKVYGLRITANNLGLFYNKELFDKAKVAYPNENWTWDDMEAAAKKLTNSTDRQYGLDLPVMANQGEWKTWMWMCFLWQNGGEYLNNERTKAVFNSQQGVEALEFWNRLSNADKAVPKEAPGAGIDRFLTGKVAMSISGPWMIRPWLQDPNMKGKLAVAPLPKKITNATQVGGEGLVVFSNTKYPKEAYEYVKHLTTDSEFMKKFYKSWITVPALKEFADFYKDDPMYGEPMKVFNEQMKIARTRQFVPQWGEITDILDRQLAETIYNNKSAKQALDEAAEKINKLLEAK